MGHGGIKVPVSDALVVRRMDAVRIFARYQYVLDPAPRYPGDITIDFVVKVLRC